MDDILFRAAVGPFNLRMPVPHRENFQLKEYTSDLPDTDVWVQTNNTQSKSYKRYRHILDHIRRCGRPWIVVEAPVFRCNQRPADDPGAYFRWSWFSYFRDQGIHYQEDSPPDRWERIRQEQDLEILPWNSPGDNILFMMQRPGDSSLIPMIERWGSYERFVADALRQIRKHTDRPIRIRMHPLRPEQQMEILAPLLKVLPDLAVSEHSTPLSDPWCSGGDSLYRDLDGAWAVVGGNSNSLVESACYGVPTFAMDPSAMAWPVANHDLGLLDEPDLGIARQQWLNNLGYCQWRRDEVEQGLCLDHLMQWWPAVTKIRKEFQDWRIKEEEEARWYEDNYINYWAREGLRNEFRRLKSWLK